MKKIPTKTRMIAASILIWRRYAFRAAVNITVSMVITAKIKKNPPVKAKISLKLRFKMEYPTTMGMSGSTHGDNKEAIPARNDNIKPGSIHIPL